MANLEHGVPISPKTVFYIGSCSKQFVTACVVLLSLQNKLSLDDDIHTYIPEIPAYNHPVLVKHLIHHTSGLRDYLTLLDIAGIDFGTFHQQEAVELVARQKELNFIPGKEYLYSNSGYLLLAEIVNRVSGQSLREFADKNIFQPLGMENSFFHDDYQKIIPNRAAGYYAEEKGEFSNFVSTFDCVGSGGLFTSVGDLFLWDQNFYHKKIGGEKFIEQMFTTGKLNNGQTLDYAFGLRINEYRGLRSEFHSGSLGGYKSGMIRFPEHKFSVICLSNLSTFEPLSLCRKTADIYLREHYLKEEKVISPYKFPKETLQEKIGYYLEPGTKSYLNFFLRGGQPIVRLSGKNISLKSVSETEFYGIDTPSSLIIKFERHRKNKSFLMKVIWEGKKPMTYENVKIVKPSLEGLKEYCGDYYNDELSVTYSIGLREEKLYFTQRNAPSGDLRPTTPDAFRIRDYYLQFTRNPEKKVRGFSLNAGRVRKLKFIKRD
jgi:CubicO group peptidase (beta-lactamase class C family)